MMRVLLVALLAGSSVACAGTIMRPVRLEQPTFALQLAAPTSVGPMERAPLAITIEGRGGFHVNLEYPLVIELTGSGEALLEQATLTSKDARELSERRARFETAARFRGTGQHRLSARVQFAVCTPDTCVPREETLAVVLDVH